MIRADERIPKSNYEIEALIQKGDSSVLEVFAEWQRRIDILVRGLEPEESTTCNAGQEVLVNG